MIEAAALDTSSESENEGSETGSDNEESEISDEESEMEEESNDVETRKFSAGSFKTMNFMPTLMKAITRKGIPSTDPDST